MKLREERGGGGLWEGEKGRGKEERAWKEGKRRGKTGVAQSEGRDWAKTAKGKDGHKKRS